MLYWLYDLLKGFIVVVTVTAYLPTEDLYSRDTERTSVNGNTYREHLHLTRANAEVATLWFCTRFFANN